MTESHIWSMFASLTLGQVIVGLTTYVSVRMIFFIYNRHIIFKTFKNLGIPGPKPGILDGNLFEYDNGKANFKVTARWRKTYGKIFGYYLGDTPVLTIADPKLLRKFLIDNQSNFTTRTKLYIETQPLSSSVLFTAGEEWKSMRKTLTPAFSKYRMKGDEATEFIDITIRLMLDYLAERHNQCKANGKETIIDVMSLMKSTALYMISKLAVKIDGVQIKEDEENVHNLEEFLKKADGPVVTWAIRFPVLQNICSFIGNNITLGPVLTNILKKLKSVMDQQLRDPESKNISRPSNIFETMVELHKEGLLTKQQVLGNAIAILFAGYDTTATTLSYLFWVLAKFPDVQEKLRTDIIANGSESAYLRMVLNETMRLYPTVGSFTQRMATEDITIDGITVNKNMIVVVDTHLLHLDPEIWPDPHNFSPERFSDMSKIDSCAFVPFGIGARICLGYQLALLEMKLIATEMLMSYKLKLIAPEKLEQQTSANVLTTSVEPIKLAFHPLNEL